MSSSAKALLLMLNEPYNELIRSIPETERLTVLWELESTSITQRAKRLQEELITGKTVGTDLKESRAVFLAALRSLKLKQISEAQLASIHILDSAIRTLYTNPMVYLDQKYLDDERQVVHNITTFSSALKMPTYV